MYVPAYVDVKCWSSVGIHFKQIAFLLDSLDFFVMVM